MTTIIMVQHENNSVSFVGGRVHILKIIEYCFIKIIIRRLIIRLKRVLVMNFIICYSSCWYFIVFDSKINCILGIGIDETKKTFPNNPKVSIKHCNGLSWTHRVITYLFIQFQFLYVCATRIETNLIIVNTYYYCGSDLINEIRWFPFSVILLNNNNKWFIY